MAAVESIKLITPAKNISELSRLNAPDSEIEQKNLFSGILSQAINNVVETDRAVVNDTENLATGNMDDLHTLGIDNMKSYLAVQMLVQIRNKALDSYNTLMQITV
ncbi:MAG: flagellar hook-basal body complex protein FliE [Anaerovoracaceae bacterium]